MPEPIKRQVPQAGQESVWDYPRPPRCEPTTKHIEVWFNDERIVATRAAYRILETSHPPTYYIPQADIAMTYLTATQQSSFCEFKGSASYWTVTVNGQSARNACWGYLRPSKGYEAITGYIAFYASRMQRCLVDGELVQAQPGDFYGGWITSDIVGPFKGAAGTMGW